MIVLRRALADRWPTLLWWCAGLVVLVVSSVALFPTVQQDANFEELANDLPPAFRSLLAFDDAVPLTSAAGYLQVRIFGSLLPVVLLVFAIGAGARAIGGAEESGWIELILMHPISRVLVVVERYGSVVSLMLVLTAVSMGALLLSAPAFGALDGVSITGAIAACAAAGLLALLHGSVAFAVGAFTGRRAPAIGSAATVAVAGYLVNGLGAVSDVVRPMRPLSPWYWYLERNMLADGPALLAIALPLVISPVLVGVAAVAFDRRDLR